MNYYFGLLGSTLTVLSTTLSTHVNFAIPDVPMAFFVTLFFLHLSVCYYKSDWRRRHIAQLALITGIAIAMKYTAALLIPTLFVVSVQYVHKNRRFVLPIKIIKKVLLFFGMFMLLSSTMIKINQQPLLDYFKALTTDGILEIEYVQTFRNFNSLVMIVGILLICLSQWNKLIQNEWVGLIISPFHLIIIFIVLIIFTVFSPFTLIEFKKSFADFMYEYRHMNIGSAAHYHHLSEQYKTIISNLSSTASALFYIQLIYGNLGIVNIIFSLFGVYFAYSQKPAFTISMVIYMALLLFTLFGWKNVAVRYTLSIFPIMIIFLTHGVYTFCKMVSKRFSVNRYLVIGLLSISVLVHPITNFMNNYAKF